MCDAFTPTHYSNYLFPLAQLVLRFDQQVYAIRTNETDDNRSDRSDNVAGMIERIRHSQNSGAQRALEQVDERVHVAAEMWFKHIV